MALEAHDVEIPLHGSTVRADLCAPDEAEAMVLFAHGSGSSRQSPRNRQVANRLQQEGLGTLLVDLLTEEEDEVDQRTTELRFDIDRLAGRVAGATEWLEAHPALRDLPLGYFGASTGAAAALVAAARTGSVVGAVVSRGGRPDLAGDALKAVAAPTLLIVGGRDDQVRRLNEDAATQLAGPHRLVVIPGATHLFAEPGALDEVAGWAVEWFRTYLVAGHRSADP